MTTSHPTLVNRLALAMLYKEALASSTIPWTEANRRRKNAHSEYQQALVAFYKKESDEVQAAFNAYYDVARYESRGNPSELTKELSKKFEVARNEFRLLRESKYSEYISAAKTVMDIIRNNKTKMDALGKSWHLDLDSMCLPAVENKSIADTFPLSYR